MAISAQDRPRSPRGFVVNTNEGSYDYIRNETLVIVSADATTCIMPARCGSGTGPHLRSEILFGGFQRERQEKGRTNPSPGRGLNGCRGIARGRWSLVSAIESDPKQAANLPAQRGIIPPRS